MKKLYFTLFLVCISLIASAQEPFGKLYEYFLGIYGGMTVSKVIQARNGDYIVSGVVSVGNVGMTNYVILVTDSSGNLKWLKEIDTPDYWPPSYESDVIQTQDNGFLFCGNDPFGRGGVLVKYDPDWNIAWNKAYQTELFSVTINRMSEDSAGYIYAYGTAFVYGPNSDVGSTDLLLMKLDGSGNILEQVTVGMSEFGEQSTRFLSLSSGDFALAGRRYNPDYTSEEILVKLNASYGVVWAKTMTTETQTHCTIQAVKEAPDGQLLLAGNIYDENYTPEPFLAKINSADGSTIWTRSYQLINNQGLQLSFSGIVADNNGNITGTGGCYNDTSSMTMIFSANDSGEIIWAKRNDADYGENIYSFFYEADIQKTASGGHIIAGSYAQVYFSLPMNQGVNLLKVSGEGSTYCTYTGLDMAAVPSPFSIDDKVVYVQPGSVYAQDTTYFNENFLASESFDDCLSLAARNPVPEMSLSVAPNPSEGKFRVTMPGARAEGNLSLFNTSGKEVYRFNSVSPAQLEAGLDVHLQVVPGIYLLEVVTGEDRVIRKVIVR